MGLLLYFWGADMRASELFMEDASVKCCVTIISGTGFKIKYEGESKMAPAF